MWHVLRLPVAFFQHRWTGDIVSRAASTARVARLISGELATTAVSLLTLVVYVAVMLPRDALLAAVGVAISGLNLVGIQWLWPLAGRPKSVDRADPGPAAGGRHVGDPDHRERQGGRIRVGPARPLERRSGPDDQRRARAGLLRYALAGRLPPLLASLTAILVLGLGGREVMIGSLSIGALVAFQSLLADFNQPFRDLARLGSDVQELRADLDRIDDVRNRPIDPVFTSVQPIAADAGNDSWTSTEP